MIGTYRKRHLGWQERHKQRHRDEKVQLRLWIKQTLVKYACNAEVLGLIPQLRRSLGEGNGNPLQYSCLENTMDREEPGELLSTGSQRVEHD